MPYPNHIHSVSYLPYPMNIFLKIIHGYGSKYVFPLFPAYMYKILTDLSLSL